MSEICDESVRVTTVYQRNGKLITTHQRRRGRRRIAPERVQVTLVLPAEIYDRAYRLATLRDVAVSQVLRECIMRWKPPSAPAVST